MIPAKKQPKTAARLAVEADLRRKAIALVTRALELATLSSAERFRLEDTKSELERGLIFELAPSQRHGIDAILRRAGKDLPVTPAEGPRAGSVRTGPLPLDPPNRQSRRWKPEFWS